MAKKAPQTSLAVELVVRRGAHRRYEELKKKTAELPVKVSWDRRKADRRVRGGETQIDRRLTDRRGKPPFTWDVSDFVVVDPTKRRHAKLHIN